MSALDKDVNGAKESSVFLQWAAAVAILARFGVLPMGVAVFVSEVLQSVVSY